MRTGLVALLNQLKRTPVGDYFAAASLAVGNAKTPEADVLTANSAATSGSSTVPPTGFR